MDTPAGQIAQRLVDHALTVHSRTTGKSIGNNIHCEVTFARTIIPSVATMFATIVDDSQK